MTTGDPLNGFVLAFTCNAQGELLACSGPGLPWLDPNSDLVGQPVARLWPALDSHSFDQAVQAALQGLESQVRTEQGGLRWAFLLEPARSNGEISGLLGVVRGLDLDEEAQPLNDAVDSWPVCVYEVDAKGCLFDINLAGAAVFGYDNANEILGRPLIELIASEDRAAVTSQINKGLAGEASQFSFSGAAGNHYTSVLFPYRRGSSGEICCLFGLAQATVPGVQPEVVLADSEQEYRLLVESSPFCIHQIDLSGHILSMNEAGLQMMGLIEESEVVGLSYIDAVSDVDRDRVAKLLARACKGHAAQFEFRSANGNVFASSFVPIWDHHGKVNRLMGLTRDVTGERKAQDALRESEQRLELALKGANLGLWDWSPQSDHMVVDKGWAQLLGYSDTDLAPSVETMRRLIHPDDHEAQHLRLQAHLNGDLPAYESIHRMRGADGRWRWVVDRGMVVRRDEQGNALRISGTSAEITSEYEAENERRDLEAKLQQAQRMESIGQLAGGIAHDFNNVLTVISGNVDFALDEVQAGRSPAECLEQIQRATDRASELIGRLLTFSRRRPVRMTVVDLNSLSRDIFDMVSRVLPENIALKFDSQPDLPMIEADPSQLEQIVLNLCLNARDSMPEGGELTISLATEVGDDGALWVALMVADNGEGMDEATLAKAFEPFFTTKPSARGSGLGLAMVYGSVQQHGGRIAIESRPNEGTKVNLSFPACDRNVDVVASPPAHSHGGAETVLVVEDESLVRDLAAKVLGRAGYQVLTAEDGQDGIEVFSRHRDVIKIVLLDVVMPRANGGEACKAMLDIKPDVRIVFTSGYNQDNALPVELMQKHQFPVMPKPYDNRTLLGHIRSMLDR